MTRLPVAFMMRFIASSRRFRMTVEKMSDAVFVWMRMAL